MLIYEFKAYGTSQQFNLVDEAIRTVQFVRNKCLRLWIDGGAKNGYDLNKYCATLANEFSFAKNLNSQARQAAAERAWAAIKHFFDSCKQKISGKKGFPSFQKNNRSVEYKTTGWKLSDDRKSISFTDGIGIGRLKMKGTRNLNFYQPEQIKRVRLVKRADGYYIQFCVAVDRQETLHPTGQKIGLDVGLESFYTDSNGVKIENPKFYRTGEKKLKRAHRRVSKKNKGSSNRRKARVRLGKAYLKVSRQRKDHAIKLARCVITSNDVVVYEDLRVKNLVRNHCLAKSIADAGWYQFRVWLEYFGKAFGRTTVAVNPAYTSQKCSSCGTVVKKSLSTRTHACQCGCYLDRDHNAGINILNLGLRATHASEETSGESEALLGTVGHTGTFGLEPSNASGESTSTLIGESLSRQVGSLKEESSRL
jgi:putative transposase